MYTTIIRTRHTCQPEAAIEPTGFQPVVIQFEQHQSLHLEISTTHPFPTALLTGYDDIAIGAMRAIYETGLKIPEDIAVVGNDNIRESSFLPQGLITISPPVREMARMGVEPAI